MYDFMNIFASTNKARSERMWLIENRCADNSHTLRRSGVLLRNVPYRPSRSANSDRWIVMLSYGAAALFGLVFWIAVVWMCW